MPNEASKAIRRRLRDPNFTAHYLVGVGLDVGGGDDGLGKQDQTWPLMKSCRTWDQGEGDAQFLQTIPDNAYDFVHSSHCLEHMRDPFVALAHWTRVLKPGGYLVVLVPDEDMYEQGVFPSTFNGDHKVTFTTFKMRSWSTHSLNLASMVQRLGAELEIIKLELIHGSYDWAADTRHDQTAGEAECAIELVARKRRDHERNNGGRFGAWHLVGP